VRQPQPDQQQEVTPERGPRWRFRLIVILVGIVAASVVMRAARTPAEPAPPPAAANALMPTPGGEPQPPPEEESTLDTVLPFVSEGGIFMILGLLLGMMTRTFLKLFLVLAILGFAGVQYLAFKGVITIHWGAMKDFVLNMVPKGASLAEILQQKLPSLGAFGLGYLLGLKRA
jgi:uncharacterized membrane protein (Fun14 family)